MFNEKTLCKFASTLLIIALLLPNIVVAGDNEIFSFEFQDIETPTLDGTHNDYYLAKCLNE